MEHESDDITASDFSVASSTVASGSDFAKYVAAYLPTERLTDFTKDEEEFVNMLVKEVGEPVWASIPKEIQLNIVRGNAHEKERLRVTTESTKKIASWRKKLNADSMLASGPLPGFEKYFDAWPSRVAGLDDFGHPILYDRFSTVSIPKMLALDESDFYKFRTQALEALMFLKDEVAKRTGTRAGKHVYILDLAGLEPTKHLTSSIQKKMRPVMQMSAEIFPETLWTVWVINAPMSFRFFWNIARTWMDPITRAKIRMFGSTKSKWQAAMAACGVHLSALPAEFGGSHPSESLADILVRAASKSSKP